MYGEVETKEFYIIQLTEQLETYEVGKDFYLGYSDTPDNMGKARDLLKKN